jgi:acetylornithine deacetylase/succinyl-diaminopimelate desuccinylase-like protein
MLDKVLQSIDARREQSLADLKTLLRIPSVSTKPEHAPDLKRCAEWLVTQLRGMKLTADVIPTKGHPIVLARSEKKPNRSTVLMYGHYDVQPPEPLEQWTTPPFEPTERNGALYARGAADDKGQVWCHVEAVRAWQQQGGLPVNLIMLIEGEEEIGSDNLEHFLQQHKDDLRADIALISDTNQFAKGLPAITYGLRGLVYMEVFLTGPSHDLHSGLYGGAVPNPANVLCEVLATLHDKDGRVNIPGFYDDVLPLTPQERDQWRRLPWNDAALARELGLHANPIAKGFESLGFTGEKDYSTMERKWARPTCDINGLTSGYQGHGAKTIIPSKASAKVSMRLVPNQNPKKIESAFRQAILERCPKHVKVEFAQHGLSGPVIVPLDSLAMKYAVNAVRTGFGAEPVMMREGGSIPVVGQIKRLLGIDTLLVGFGLPDDRVHSPNEKFDLDAFHRGTRTAASLYHELAQLPR